MSTGAATLPNTGVWQRRPELRFPVRFTAFAVVAAGAWALARPLWPLLQGLTASTVAWLSRLAGLEAEALAGARVAFREGDLPEFAYRITDGCTAVSLVGVYVVAVAAYPAERRQRLTGLAAGVPVLFLLNFLRLVMLGWVGLHTPRLFDPLHSYWWEAFFLLSLGAMWFAWVWFVADGPRTMSPQRKGKRWPPTPAAGTWPTTVVALGALFGVVAAVGLWGGGFATYGRLFEVPADVVVHALWQGTVTVSPPAGAAAVTYYGFQCALFTAVLALFLVSPGVPLAKRVQGAVLVGVPTVAVLQIGVEVAIVTLQTQAPGGQLTGAQESWQAFFTALSIALHIGVVPVIWRAWAARHRRTAKLTSSASRSSRTPYARRRQHARR